MYKPRTKYLYDEALLFDGHLPPANLVRLHLEHALQVVLGIDVDPQLVRPRGGKLQKSLMSNNGSGMDKTTYEATLFEIWDAAICLRLPHLGLVQGHVPGVIQAIAAHCLQQNQEAINFPSKNNKYRVANGLGDPRLVKFVWWILDVLDETRRSTNDNKEIGVDGLAWREPEYQIISTCHRSKFRTNRFTVAETVSGPRWLSPSQPAAATQPGSGIRPRCPSDRRSSLTSC